VSEERTNHTVNLKLPLATRHSPLAPHFTRTFNAMQCNAAQTHSLTRWHETVSNLQSIGKTRIIIQNAGNFIVPVPPYRLMRSLTHTHARSYLAYCSLTLCGGRATLLDMEVRPVISPVGCNGRTRTPAPCLGAAVASGERE
jgi:hypothetical protein